MHQYGSAQSEFSAHCAPKSSGSGVHPKEESASAT
jgi:hypothetical protein